MKEETFIRAYNYDFEYVYESIVKKALRKRRTEEEVYEVTSWLTGYTVDELINLRSSKIKYGEFFDQAPKMNPDREFIKGRICGDKIEEIQNPTMKSFRQLDKLIDELAKGNPLEKIMTRKK